jgi:hypothetical protein
MVSFMLDIISRILLSTHLLQYPESNCDARLRNVDLGEDHVAFLCLRAFCTAVLWTTDSDFLAFSNLHSGWGQSVAEFAELWRHATWLEMAVRKILGQTDLLQLKALSAVG